MSAAAILITDLAGELALFKVAGFLLFALDDLLVDRVYFTRLLWRWRAASAPTPTTV